MNLLGSESGASSGDKYGLGPMDSGDSKYELGVYFPFCRTLCFVSVRCEVSTFRRWKIYFSREALECLLSLHWYPWYVGRFFLRGSSLLPRPSITSCTGTVHACHKSDKCSVALSWYAAWFKCSVAPECLLWSEAQVLQPAPNDFAYKRWYHGIANENLSK